MSQEKKKLVVLLLSSVLVLLFITAVYMIKHSNVVKEAKEEEVEKEKLIRVSLIINDGVNESTLSAKLESGASVYDLMEHFREKGQLKYEVTNYTFGEVLDSINGLENNRMGKTWMLYVDSFLTKDNIKEIELQKGSVYLFKYESGSN